MPLITFYATKGSISPAEKEVLVQKVTALYTRIMPRFYVVIVFKDLEKGEFFFGGKAVDGDFVRITHEHLAIHFSNQPSPSRASQSFLDRASAVYTEVLGSRGVRYEFHIVQSPREHWRIDGLNPPPTGSAEETVWREEGKTSRWSGDGFEGVEKILRGDSNL